MLEHTPAAARAIESRERVFTHRLMVDWDRTGAYDHPLSDLSAYVVELEREHALSSTIPAEARLIEGYAAASLPLTLAGDYDGQPLAAHFSPYNGRGAFYATGIPLGVRMYYDLGVWTEQGWEWFRQFTGLVREPEPDRATGEVRLECLDNVEANRAGVDLAPYALFEDYLKNGFKRGMLVDSSSIIDVAARSGGFTMGPQRFPTWPAYWPPADVSVVLSAPLHGSIIPEIGTLDNDQSFHLTEQWERDPNTAGRAEAYRAGPHGYLALAAVPRGRNAWNYTKYWIDDARQSAGSIDGTWQLGAWLYWTGDSVDEDSTMLEVRIRGNRLQLVLEGTNGGIAPRLIEHAGTATTGAYRFLGSVGWHYVEVGFEISDRQDWVRMRTRIDDAISPVEQVRSHYPGNVNDVLSGLVTIENTYAVSDAYVLEASYYDGLAYLAHDLTPLDTARLSWGGNRLAYTLKDNGREAWQLATEVAAAEFGAVLFDEYGRFVFRTQADIVAQQTTPVRTFTVDDLSGLGLRATLDSIRNVWTVTTRTARAAHGTVYDLGDDGTPLYRDTYSGELLPDDFIIPPASAKELFVPTNTTTIAVDPGRLPYLPETAPWEQHAPASGIKSYTGPNYRGSGPNTEQKFVSRDLFRLWVHNGYAEPVGFYTPDEQPRFRVGGTVITEDAPKTWSVRNEDSIARHGERVIELDDTVWLQDEYQTRAMLSTLVSRMGRPIPVSDTLTVPGDPRIQIGDTITIEDTNGFGASILCQIYGITRTFSTTSGLTDTYTVEMVTPPGQGIWDSPTYGLWNQSLIWS